ncbi:hypothetical protein AB0F17_58610 [Nonomuraea sp. NPDC026600]
MNLRIVVALLTGLILATLAAALLALATHAAAPASVPGPAHIARWEA